MNVTDERENLVNDICIALGAYQLDMQEIKNLLYMILDPYEITGRCTEVAELKQDRNDYLLRRFLVAKTVKGCSKRTLKAYRTGLVMILRSIGKTVDDITADDIRYYLAVRQRRDGISKTTADNELRYLRTFFPIPDVGGAGFQEPNGQSGPGEMRTPEERNIHGYRDRKDPDESEWGAGAGNRGNPVIYRMPCIGTG